MNPEVILQKHLALCDELYQLAVEENRILRQEQRAPDEAWREKKRHVSERLDQSLAELKSLERGPNFRGGAVLEQARARSLQILMLDRENEQLLLRCSMGAPRPAPSMAAPKPAVNRAYGQTS